ncbi:MAG: hypothetical protein P8R42_20410 [Candidatus Binatia bacterium]|nr:hypothetical protein [Candidatus Binatia bacterium]
MISTAGSRGRTAKSIAGPPSFDLSNAGPYTEIEGGADLICGVIGTAAIECWMTGGTTTFLRVAVE